MMTERTLLTLIDWRPLCNINRIAPAIYCQPPLQGKQWMPDYFTPGSFGQHALDTTTIPAGQNRSAGVLAGEFGRRHAARIKPNPEFMQRDAAGTRRRAGGVTVVVRSCALLRRGLPVAHDVGREFVVMTWRDARLEPGRRAAITARDNLADRVQPGNHRRLFVRHTQLQKLTFGPQLRSDLREQGLNPFARRRRNGHRLRMLLLQPV